METWLDESYGKLEFDSKNRIIKLTLIGDISDENYKHIWNFGLEEAVKENCGNVFVDQRQIGYIKMMSRAWLMLKWMPKSKLVMKDTERKLAIIPSKHIVHQAGLNYLLDSLKKVLGYTFEFFESEEEVISFFSSTKKEQ
ncbi:hypothetical protein Fleli_3032 [Bernardetia litoralis DSM 6794]|uniref:STAS/SEC14 domain-containing protein n=1 Tax=Bernardetia litoralis (strain ATCC 23117 / DSM 6794 / NBRC 15988 / NCIMB 1366 / Fx l1 / Sio-4) TaxID=880071 RepID=I4AN38_BERLS|nr:hypothetical protein [Bernardetia litoralis]AFM05373.1 hypothetical protein Fleli_3032 [Bernardetia litoralis DSM 6794]